MAFHLFLLKKKNGNVCWFENFLYLCSDNTLYKKNNLNFTEMKKEEEKKKDEKMTLSIEELENVAGGCRTH